jgi:pSer/pThr/pTyr-binding forkhead associated (FHA) protein
MRIPRLIALQDDIQPGLYDLENNLYIIGRADTCQIIVSDKAVSRIHASIERDGPYCYLHDANSANGTYINGQLIQEKHLLKDQDEIGLGRSTPLLRFEDSESTTDLLPRLRYDEQKMRFYLNRVPIQLTPNELRLLRFLFEHAGVVCLTEKCAEAVWERAYDPGPDDEGLDKLVSKIRKKLKEIGQKEGVETDGVIETRRGIGHLLNH